MQKSNISLDYSYPGHPAKKHSCPACKKRRFVRYINLATNELYPEEYGRCDREDSCGYFMHPKEGGILTKEDYARRRAEDDTRPQEVELDFKTIDRAVMVKSLTSFHINNLFLWFKEKLGEQKATDIFWLFYAGTAKDGSTIFWQVDEHLNPRTANKVQYKGFNRDKEHLPYRLFKTQDGYKSCLFGLHQLHGITDKDAYRIGIVESEKTAMLCEVFLPYMPFAGVEKKMIWLASCACDGLTREKVAPLKGWKVILIPDFSWLSRAKWGLTPMRKKAVWDAEFINPTTLQRGREMIRMHEDGEIEVGYESALDRIEDAGADYCQGFDYMPDATDGSDIADVLKNWDADTEIYERSDITFKKPNFTKYKITQAANSVIYNAAFDLEEKKQKFLAVPMVKELIKRFDLYVQEVQTL